DCGPQLPTGKNIPYTHLMATVYFCAEAVLDPALPVNEALYRAVRVIAAEGRDVNPRPPAAVRSRHQPSMIFADARLHACGEAARAARDTDPWLGGEAGDAGRAAALRRAGAWRGGAGFARRLHRQPGDAARTEAAADGQRVAAGGGGPAVHPLARRRRVRRP